MVHILPERAKATYTARLSRVVCPLKVLSSHCFVPVVEEAALFVNGWSDYLWIKDISMCWISGEPEARKPLAGRCEQVHPLTGRQAIVNILLILLLAGCSTPWNSGSSAVMPTPTAQFAGGEPILPQLQKLYLDAPLPSSHDVTAANQFWSLAGHDIANTSAIIGSPVRGNIQWFFQTPGPVLASPVVAGGLMLVQWGGGVPFVRDD